jgi:hypothetical protein
MDLGLKNKTALILGAGGGLPPRLKSITCLRGSSGPIRARNAEEGTGAYPG